MTATDAHGVELTGTAAGVAAFDAALEALLYFRPSVMDDALAIAAADRGCPMGAILPTYLGVLDTDANHFKRAAYHFSAWRDETGVGRLTEREQGHVAVLEAWLRGDWGRASALLEELSLQHPRDVLALLAGHQLDFFTGDAVRLRDRISGALWDWKPGDLHYSLLLGMAAFGLEESGDYERAEEIGAEAVSIDPADVWAIHAVVHTHEMRARWEAGLEFLDPRVEDWGKGNFFRVHNWWHYCLFALEAGRVDVALRIFDTVLAPAPSASEVMELLDASALLWRLRLDGYEEAARWTALVPAWEAKTATAHYAFNDVHAVMTYVGADAMADAEKLIADRIAYLDGGAAPISNRRFTEMIGLPSCRALLAFGQDRYDDVIEQLWPIRRQLAVFGGSHAQRDALQRTLLEAAVRGGRTDVAHTLLSERSLVKPASPYNQWMAARLAAGSGTGRRPWPTVSAAPMAAAASLG
jgi:tetratricopeptide (TPR) repeat protein